MKKYLILPVLAAFAVSPALAQQDNGVKAPDATGSNIEAIKEAPAGTIDPKTGKPMSPSEAKTGNEGKDDNKVTGAKESSQPGAMDAGRASTPDASPSNQKTGNKGEEDNKLPTGAPAAK